MALNANCVANVTTSGSDSNAGWFDTSSGDTAGGANDRAFSNSPVIIDGSTITASVHTTTTQATLVGFTVTSALRGNVLRISGGTATAGYYRITATDAVNNRVTVDASMGSSGATITGRIGGAFASPAMIGATAVGGFAAYIKAGTYDVTSTSTNVSGGALLITVGGTRTTRQQIVGYGTTYGDRAATPIVRASGISNAFLWTINGSTTYVDNIEFDGQSLTGMSGIRYDGNASYGRVRFCIAKNLPGTGILNSRGGLAIEHCYAESCGTGIAYSGTVPSASIIRHCAAKSCGVGFQCIHIVHCIAWNCTRGIEAVDGSGHVVSCVAYGCSASGIRLLFNTGGGTSGAIDCIAVSCGTGFDSNVQTNLPLLQRIATQGNTTAISVNLSATPTESHALLTADPFTNAAGGDFSLNNTAGGGAVLRTLNFALPGISTTRYPFGGWYPPSNGGSAPAFSGGRWQ